MSRHFPSFMQAFMEYTSSVEANQKFLKWSAISSISGALERKVWIVYNGLDYVYPNQYIVFVGPTGSRKSSSTKHAMGILQKLENLKFMSAATTPAGLVKQLFEAGKDKSINIEGTSYPHSSLYLYSSEAATTLGPKLYGSMIELMTDFYEGGTYSGWSLTQGWSKELKSENRITILNPCLNMLLCSTPEWLVKSIGTDEIKGGFAARMIFVVQKESQAFRSIGWLDDTDIKHADVNMQEKLVQDLAEISKLNGRFKTESTWKEVFNIAKVQIDTFAHENPKHILAGYYKRKLWHIMKLAQVLNVDRSAEMLLTGDDFTNALNLLNEVEPDMQTAFGLRGKNVKANGLNELWEVMRMHKRITKSSLRNTFVADMDSAAFDDAIKSLYEMRRIRISFGSDGHTYYDILDHTPLI